MTTAPRSPAQKPSQATSNCKFTSDQYDWLIEAGFITTEHRVELIRGEILTMTPMGDNHRRSTRRLNLWLVRNAGQDYIPQCQVTISLANDFTPDPDFSLLRYREDEYNEGDSPTQADVLLIIEVADSSLAYDLGDKSLAYARAGIPELWVVDLPHQQVHRFTGPSPQGYQEHSTAAEDETMTPSLIPSLQLPVHDTL